MCTTLRSFCFLGGCSSAPRLTCFRCLLLVFCLLGLHSLFATSSGVLIAAATAPDPTDSTVFDADADERIRNAAEDDFYDVLGLSTEREDATERQVKAAWRQLSKKYHPDLSGGEAARLIYQRVQSAYNVLGDRRKRKAYDILGLEGVKKIEQLQNQQQQNQAGAAMHPFFHLFNDATRSSDRGEDATLLLQLPLEDVYHGAAHQMHFAKNRICRACRGSGAKSAVHVKPCTHCNGHGTIRRQIQIMPRFVQQVEQTCPSCNGAGKQITAQCPVCRGKKITREQAHISLDIEPGVPEGTELRYEMEADQEPGKVPGDVVLYVATLPHPVFTRHGNNLHVEVQLTLKEALLGFNKKLTHLGGHEVTLRHDGITHSGAQRTVAGEGMPRHDKPSQRGHLMVTYTVKMPTKLTQQQRATWESTMSQS